MGSYKSYDLDSENSIDAYYSIFETLTVKQREVYALVAEGRSSKEIAWKLGISDSAVNQRIEAVRSRAGSPTRAELARAYRSFSTNRDVFGRDREVTYVSRPAGSYFPSTELCDCSASHMVAETTAPASAIISDRGYREGTIVPPAFLGPNAALNRIAAMMVIAVGLLSAALISLSVIHALATFL